MKEAGINSWFCILAMSVAVLFTVQPLYAQDEPEWHQFEQALTVADSAEKPILIDVGAPWCGWCHKMKKEVYPNLGDRISRQFIFTRLNRDDKRSDHNYGGRPLSPWEITRKLGVQNIPAVVILDESGNYIAHLSGYIEAAKLQQILQQVVTRLERKESTSLSTPFREL